MRDYSERVKWTKTSVFRRELYDNVLINALLCLAELTSLNNDFFLFFFAERIALWQKSMYGCYDKGSFQSLQFSFANGKRSEINWQKRRLVTEAEKSTCLLNGKTFSIPQLIYTANTPRWCKRCTHELVKQFYWPTNRDCLSLYRDYALLYVHAIDMKTIQIFLIGGGNRLGEVRNDSFIASLFPEGRPNQLGPLIRWAKTLHAKFSDPQNPEDVSCFAPSISNLYS